VVEVLRRYSRHRQLWRTAKRLVVLLDSARKPQRTQPEPVLGPVHRLEVRLGTDVIAQLVADYQAGMEVPALQERYGLGRGSVQRLMREAGVTRHRQPLTAAQLDEAVRLYASGRTIREVAATMDLPKTTVQDALTRSKVAMRPAARRRRA
jgi:hypothetical protein